MKNKVVITNIFWKRTYLFVEYESEKEVELSIVKTKTIDEEKVITKSHVLETKKLEGNKYRSKINITIAETRALLEKGKWCFIINNDLNNKPLISENILYNIEDISRVFLYSNKYYAYIITFEINKNIDEREELESFYLSLRADYYEKNFKPNKRTFREVRKNSGFKDLLHKVFIRLAKIILNLYYQILTHITIKNGKRVLFMSENRERIMDNLEAIDKRMKERGLDKEFEVSYSFRNIFKSERQNPFKWISVITKIAMQDYIFVDDYVPVFSFLKLNKKTTLVQTWHAGFGFKLVGFGRFGINGSPHPIQSCHRKYTYGIVGNNNLKEIYSEVWGIDKDSLLATGMPRLEHFLDEDLIKEKRKFFYENYPEFKNKRVINFAPTYRGSNQYNAYYDYSKLDFDKLTAYCKKTNSVFIFGKHHFIKEEIPIKKEHEGYLYDFSKYKLNDTFYITDVLITDYSSCFYDFLLLKKPVIFYTYDKAIYSSTRGVHRPIDKVAPGIVCETFDELLNALDSTNKKDFEIKDFLIDKCLTNEMLASDQIIDYVLLKKDVKGL